MAKKPHRGSPLVDMTAMVDVAFLLLTFFILTTTKFREDSAAEVKVPSSISDTKAPPTNLMTITVSDSGKVFVGYSDIGTRKAVLENLIKDQLVKPVTEKELAAFSTVGDFGVPMGVLDQWLKLSDKEANAFVQPGVPAIDDAVSAKASELKEWIKYGRIADHNDGDEKELRIAIKGDANAPYSDVQKVISALQDFDINQFNLLTDSEAGAAKKAEVAKAKKP